MQLFATLAARPNLRKGWTPSLLLTIAAGSSVAQ